MKKLFLLALCTVFAASTFAQENEAPAKKPSVKGFVSNGFWDNWEVSVGAGPATENIHNNFGKGDHGSFWHRIGWEANVSATKWIHPVFGARLQLQGGQFKNWRTALSEAPEWTPTIFVHADFMINLSNWIGGYREDRVYYAVPFAGFGYQSEDITDSAQSHGCLRNDNYAFTAGLLNKFRVCKSLDINLELKWWYYPERGHSMYDNGKSICAYSATAGITYRFNKRDWKREFVYTGPDAAAYAAMVAEKDAAIAAAVAEAERLRAAANKPAQVVEKPVYLTGKSITFFEIGKSTISEKEKVRLNIAAEQIKKSPADKVYHIQGHADPQTGSAARNQKLSEARAKAVYDYLISQGVDAKQLDYKGLGSTVEPFSSPATNRVTITE